MNLLLSYAGWEADPWVDRLPRLLEPMGIHSHRAPSGRAASDVIKSIPIHIAVVDLALPMDGNAPSTTTPSGPDGGPSLLSLLSRLASPPPTLVIKRARSSRDDQAELSAALRAGAFAVMDRPRSDRDLELLLEMLRRVLQRHYQGRWPGPA